MSVEDLKEPVQTNHKMMSFFLQHDMSSACLHISAPCTSQPILQIGMLLAKKPGHRIDVSSRHQLELKTAGSISSKQPSTHTNAAIPALGPLLNTQGCRELPQHSQRPYLAGLEERSTVAATGSSLSPSCLSSRDSEGTRGAKASCKSASASETAATKHCTAAQVQFQEERGFCPFRYV